MTLSEYQKLSARTMSTSNTQPLLIWALGLVGEALEAVQERSYLQALEVTAPPSACQNAQSRLVTELGDVLWYAAAICTHQGWDLGALVSPGFNTPRKLLRSASGVCEPIKKHLGHGKPLDEPRIKGALWFVVRDVAFISSKYRWTLDDICKINVDKLRKRWPDGFKTADGGQ